MKAVRDGISPQFIASQWQQDLERFIEMRERYLLY